MYCSTQRGHTLMTGLDPPAQAELASTQDRYRQYSLKSDLASCYSKMSPFLFQACAVCADLQGAVTHSLTLTHTRRVESRPVVTTDMHDWSPVENCKKQMVFKFLSPFPFSYHVFFPPFSFNKL